MDETTHQILHRGEYAGNRGGSFYSTDADFAREFTQSGRACEVTTVRVDSARIYEAHAVPFAGDEDAMDAAMAAARAGGFGAIWVDEGHRQPRSVFVLDKEILQPVVTRRGAVTGPAVALELLPEAAFRIANWSDGASRKRQDEARRILKEAGFRIETVPAPKDRLGPIPYEIYVYRSPSERRACFEANSPAEEPSTTLGPRTP